MNDNRLLSAQHNLSLPEGWSSNFNSKSDDDATLDIYRIEHNSSSPSQPIIISHCLTINYDLTWILYVHGHKVHKELCKPLESFPDILDSSAINELVKGLDFLNVCIGNPDTHFIELCGSDTGQIKGRDGNVTAFKDTYCAVRLQKKCYKVTLRTTKCELLVNDGAKCDSCNRYRAVLRALYSRR